MDPELPGEYASEEPTPPVVDDEAARQAELEASRRKLAELEADRPLWEEAARQRAAQEADEERRRDTAARQARQAADEAARQAQQAAEEARRSQRAAEEAARREAKAAEQERIKEEEERERVALRMRREEVRREARAGFGRWRYLPWSNDASYDHFVKASEQFDKLDFRKGDVVVFETIPWPMLTRPGTFFVEDITWQAVEKFFECARYYNTTSQFRDLVEKAHKRFHPDRWRSRRVLNCVEDGEEKACLEMAANTVAQALTPLWKEVTGR